MNHRKPTERNGKSVLKPIVVLFLMINEKKKNNANPPIILRLPIVDEDLIFDDIQYEMPKLNKPLIFIKNTKTSGGASAMRAGEGEDDDYIKPNEEIIMPANKKVSGKMINTGFRFIKNNNWPKKTSTRCWWCCFNFENTPCAIPFKYNDNSFYVVGCFCSFNCTQAYIIENIVDKKWEKTSLLHLMYRKIYNSNEKIIATPKKEVFIEYGGNVEFAEWKKNKTYKKILYDIIIPPIYNIKPRISIENITQSYNKLDRQSIIGLGSNMDDGTGGNLFAKSQDIPKNANTKDFLSFFI